MTKLYVYFDLYYAKEYLGIVFLFFDFWVSFDELQQHIWVLLLKDKEKNYFLNRQCKNLVEKYL